MVALLQVENMQFVLRVGVVTTVRCLTSEVGEAQQISMKLRREIWQGIDIGYLSFR